eukprot:m51a1_g2620 putative squamous cell carcinoma antigen recognized by t-cells 3 (805) ;mRNA; r:532367-535508
MSGNSSESSGDEMDTRGASGANPTAAEMSLDRLETRVRAEPFNFSLAVEYVTASRSAGDLPRLRAARESIAARFPLPEELWAQWIDDEERIVVAGDEASCAALEGLYKRALGDYVSAELWARYCSFLATTAGAPVERVRSAFEEALSVVGLHVAEGSLVWNAYRLWETSAGADKERTFKMYQRQLSVPLMGMEDVLGQFEAWAQEEDIDEDNREAVRSVYQKASEQLAKRDPYELAIRDSGTPLAPDYTKYASWIQYLTFEEIEDNTSRIQCLYERAVKIYLLVPDLWLLYIKFAEKKIASSQATILSIYERAVRNCASSGALWAGYLRCTERFGKAPSEVSAVFAKSLEVLTAPDALADVHGAHIDYCRRRLAGRTDAEGVARLRAACDGAAKAIAESHAGSDAHVAVLQHWAALEARVLGDGDKAKELCELVLKERAKDAQAWLDSIEIERGLGHEERVRSLFKRALGAASDNVERVAFCWLQFEREVGTLEQWTHASERCSTKLSQIQEKRERERASAAAAAAAHAQAAQRASDRTAKKRAPERSAPAAPAPEEKRPRANLQVSGDRNSRTLHVSNLQFALKDVDVRDVFKEYGDILAVRMGKDPHGRSKGFAFVEFATEQGATDALAANGKLVRGREMHVERSSTDKAAMPRREPAVAHQQQQQQGSNGSSLPPNRTAQDEACTAFVKNIAFSVTKEELEKLFSEKGKLKEVRMATNPEGAFKGYAYVQFEDEQSVAASLELDKHELHGRHISVQRSNPPGPGRKLGALAGRLDDDNGMQVDPPEPKGSVTFAMPRALKK